MQLDRRLTRAAYLSISEVKLLTPSERRIRSQIGAHTSWANTADRSARTANGRRAFEEKFLAEAGGDPKRAESLRKAYFARLALKSAQSRRRKSGVAS